MALCSLLEVEFFATVISPFGLLQNPNEPPLQHEKKGATEVDSSEPPL
jgi:hypothetical protein